MGDKEGDSSMLITGRRDGFFVGFREGDKVGDNDGSSVGWSSSDPTGGQISDSGSSTMILGHQVMSAKHFSPFS